MNLKGRKIIISLFVLSIIFTMLGSTFAYLTWSTSSEQLTEVTFKAVGSFSCSARGGTSIAGSEVSLIPTTCDDSSHVIKKEINTNVENLSGTSAYMNMWLEMDMLGSYFSNNEDLKYVLTTDGDSCSAGVIGSGNFSELTQGDRLLLIESKEFEKSKEDSYYLWIWLDASETEVPPLEEEARSFSLSLNGECNDKEVVEDFEVTNSTTNYQLLSVTAKNVNRNIVSYAITKSNEEPTEWSDIGSDAIDKSYTLNETVGEVGTYNVWFKDTNGNTISKELEVTEVDSTAPACNFGEFSKSVLLEGDTSQVDLVCTDNESGMKDINLTTDDIVISNASTYRLRNVSQNNSIVIQNITRSNIDNGYKYTITLTHGSEYGSAILSLKEDSIKDLVKNSTDSVSSSQIAYASVFNISYKDIDNKEFSGVHEAEYPLNYIPGEVTRLDMPTKSGYTFAGYYLSSDGSGEFINKIDETQFENLILYAKWIDNPPYGTASLSLNDGVFTLSLSDYGDDGSGLTNTYGYALISNGSCENATYENSTELSKSYSGEYEIGTIYYGCIKLTDNEGSVGYIKSNDVEYLNASGMEIYMEVGEHSFTVPLTGTYKLEVWGAQGGGPSNGPGGYGGYSTGYISLTQDEEIYIHVGGAGISTSSTTTISGGYNGGGVGYGQSNKTSGSGGGATHIAKVNGLLSELVDYKGNLYDDGLTYDSSYILIVGGGGGGGFYQNSSYYGSGGSGGGISGGNGYSKGQISNTGPGGNQISGGGGFGYGQSATKNDYYGGGGGWYGGSIGTYYGSAGGGSGYIGSSLLTDKYMYCYNCSTSNNEHTKTYTTTNVSDTPTKDYAKRGNGAARITYNINNDVNSLKLTYNNNGGSGCTSKSIITGNTYGNLCTPIRSGYKFDGWYTEQAGGTKITSTTEVIVTENQTVYAHWVESTNPVISFSENGNQGYVSGDISSIINVTRGSNSLDGSSFKYIYSTDIDAEPTKIFISGLSVKLENSTGVYYLIAQACDVEGNCVKKISNPFYVDNKDPFGVINITSGILSINALVNAVDEGSGIKEYGYLIQNHSSCPTTGYIISNSSEYAFNIVNDGTYYVCVKIVDKTENSFYVISSSISRGGVLYTEVGEHVFITPRDDVYKLEVWGAQGGMATSESFGGGYGGYSVGIIELTANTNLFINVGGKGTDSTSGTVATYAGGYNGGGNGYNHRNSNGTSGSGGGGATHIATISGELSKLESYKGNLYSDGLTYNSSDILIVAGGGGGSHTDTDGNGYAGIGGSGGGFEGTSIIQTGTCSSSCTSYKFPSGGTQLTGGLGVTSWSSGTTSSTNYVGTFGKGATGTNSYGGGGGGFYGGASGQYNGGGGGSGYIGSSLLTNKYMYCYNCTTSEEEHTKTYTTTNVSDTPTKDYAKSGDGAAKITYLGNENVTSIILKYNNNGGSGCEYSKAVFGQIYGELCTPVRDGYHFAGWYTELTGGTKITSDTIVNTTENQTLYAHWSDANKPNIIFDVYGNDDYVVGNINNVITIYQGNNELDDSSLKYIWSKDINANPNEIYISGEKITLENATGVYYLIAQACDIEGNCTREISNPFYVDNSLPSGSVNLTSIDNITLFAKVDVADDSGIAKYEYLIQTESVCPTSGYITSENSNYSFNIYDEGIYTVCVRVTDNVGHTIVFSNTIDFMTEFISYNKISSNYSCANQTVGDEPIFTYTGNCEVIQVDNVGWKIKFLSSGDLVFNTNIYIEAFLVGAGGAGVCGEMSSYDTLYCSSGGGGYHTVIESSIVNGTTYKITIGQPNGGATSAFDTTIGGGGDGRVTNNNGITGAGGSACYEFEEETGDILYSGIHDERGVIPPEGTGRGGWHIKSVYGSTSGSSGIVIIRNKIADVTINYENNGGRGCDTKYTMNGYAYGELCTPVKEGYAFLGWYTSDNFETEINSDDVVTATGNITLYALWTERVEYSCSNISYGENPVFTYTGNCKLFQYENPDDWRVRFLTSGSLVFNKDVDIDAFLVGAGGGSGCHTHDEGHTTCPNGGGGYHDVIQSSLVANTSYAITVGQPNGGSTSAFGSTISGGSNGRWQGSQSYGGAGGSACYEFYESSGDVLYSGVVSSVGSGAANTGRGGDSSASQGVEIATGGSGIVIIRNQR